MTLTAADRLAILDVVTQADEAASRRDADAYVALFTPDAVLDGTKGRHAGRSPIIVRTAAAITQTLRRDAGQWRIARRTVSDPGR